MILAFLLITEHTNNGQPKTARVESAIDEHIFIRTIGRKCNHLPGFSAAGLGGTHSVGRRKYLARFAVAACRVQALFAPVISTPA